MQPPRSRRRKEARPAELLDAALDVFAAKGFAAARMEDIAARAGVSKGTAYLYFDSKQAVFEALVRSALLPNLEHLETMLAGGRLSTLDAFRAMATVIARVMENHRLIALPKLVLAESGNFPDLARFYRREMVDRGLRLIAGLLERGMERGEIRRTDPVVTARLVVAPLLMAAIFRTTFDPLDEAAAIPPATILEAHLDMLSRALRPEPDAGVPKP